MTQEQQQQLHNYSISFDLLLSEYAKRFSHNDIVDWNRVALVLSQKMNNTIQLNQQVRI
jgi:hypothetical protein